MRRFNTPRPLVLLSRVSILRNCEAFVPNFTVAELHALYGTDALIYAHTVYTRIYTVYTRIYGQHSDPLPSRSKQRVGGSALTTKLPMHVQHEAPRAGGRAAEGMGVLIRERTSRPSNIGREGAPPPRIKHTPLLCMFYTARGYDPCRA
ncbi:hypothetical protein EVAR_7883_1 [Eumeta japonica]|uniref:Uncharacterized protein n=1 Tax=Eumeta variegata TaxID=151549 RepID=A0A4C1TV62_EUMVA|nr:hypothetical protein EVAR_7883_1 [Eumeta japonica]